jgi:hypothetical protein
MVNVVVSRKRFVNVSTHGTGGVIDTTVPVTLKNVPTIISGTGVHTVDQLTDVNLTQRTDGSTLIYDQPTNTYIVREMDYAEVHGNIDGGEF